MNAFRLENIKSFKDSGVIEIKPITIFVGKNSCGKSSVLRFPAVLAQTASQPYSTHPIIFSGENIDYGNYNDVLKYGAETIAFTISYNLNQRNRQRVQEVSVRVELNNSGNLVKVQKFELFIEDEKILTLYCRNDGENGIYTLSLHKVYYQKRRFCDVDYSLELNCDDTNSGLNGFEFFFPIFNLNEIVKRFLQYYCFEDYENIKNEELYDWFQSSETRLSSEAEDIYNSLKYYINNVIKSIKTSFLDEFRKNTVYIGPFRKYPERIYRNSETLRSSVGSKGENASEILFQNSKYASNGLFDGVSNWLKDNVGYELRINKLSDDFFQLMLKDNQGHDNNILDVGFGISQILPIVTEVELMKKQKIDPNTKNLLIIEQPELHLHPAAQANLADLFVDCVTNQRNNNRIIIETHSEHLIRKLQVKIAEQNNGFTNDMLAVYYVDKDNEDGSTTIKEMRISEQGRLIDEWPSGFFDKASELSLDLINAILNNN